MEVFIRCDSSFFFSKISFWEDHVLSSEIEEPQKKKWSTSIVAGVLRYTWYFLADFKTRASRLRRPTLFCSGRRLTWQTTHTPLPNSWSVEQTEITSRWTDSRQRPRYKNIEPAKEIGTLLFPRFGVNPFGTPEPLPIQYPSNFVPKTGFQL